MQLMLSFHLRNAGVDINYISESMGHSSTDHSITERYIDHYPLEKQMEYNALLLNLETRVRDKLSLLYRNKSYFHGRDDSVHSQIAMNNIYSCKEYFCLF